MFQMATKIHISKTSNELAEMDSVENANRADVIHLHNTFSRYSSIGPMAHVGGVDEKLPIE